MLDHAGEPSVDSPAKPITSRRGCCPAGAIIEHLDGMQRVFFPAPAEQSKSA